MSYQLMAWAAQQTTGSATRKAVLLALANRANHDTGRCDPSVERICEETELAERSVRQALADLADTGLIQRERKRRADGSLGTYRYSFPLADPAPPAAADAGRPAAADAAQNQEVPNRVEELAIARSSREVTKYDPQKGTKIEGRNLPFDALCQATGASATHDAKQVATALKAIRGRAFGGAAIESDPATVEAALASAIHDHAAAYRERWPDIELTPTALAKHWDRVTQPRTNGHANGHPPRRYGYGVTSSELGEWAAQLRSEGR